MARRAGNCPDAPGTERLHAHWIDVRNLKASAGGVSNAGGSAGNVNNSGTRQAKPQFAHSLAELRFLARRNDQMGVAGAQAKF